MSVRVSNALACVSACTLALGTEAQELATSANTIASVFMTISTAAGCRRGDCPLHSWLPQPGPETILAGRPMPPRPPPVLALALPAFLATGWGWPRRQGRPPPVPPVGPNARGRDA